MVAHLRLPGTAVSLELPAGWSALDSETTSVAVGPAGPLFAPTLIALAADESTSLTDGLAVVNDPLVLRHSQGEGPLRERLQFAYFASLVNVTVDQILLRLDDRHLVITATVATASFPDDWPVVAGVLDRAVAL